MKNNFDIFVDEYRINMHFELIKFNSYSQELLKKLHEKIGIYLFFNNHEIYIGESTNVSGRLKQHYNQKLNDSHKIWSVISPYLNRSATYDVETEIINLVYGSEAKKNLLNEDISQKNHNYFMKFWYQKIINFLWNEMLEDEIVDKTINQIQQMETYKLSPYKKLTPLQFEKYEEITRELVFGNNISIKGKIGSGKSLLLSKILLFLAKKPNIKIALTSGVIENLTKWKTIFQNLNLAKNIIFESTTMLIKNNQEFDYILVDEAHRLKRDNTGKISKVVTKHIKSQNELNDLSSLTKSLIIVYDNKQRMRESDIKINDYQNWLIRNNVLEFELNEQIRIPVNYEMVVDYLFSNSLSVPTFELDNYDFKIFNDLELMINELKAINSLNRCLTATNSKKWISNKNPNLFDFRYRNIKLRYKKKTKKDWFSSKEAWNFEEVAYYDFVQGADIEYLGIIVEDDLKIESNQIIGETNMAYHGGSAMQLPTKKNNPYYQEDVTLMVKKRYLSLFKRGIKGTYVFFSNQNTYNFFKAKLDKIKKDDLG